jgi:isoleucyl-tRNA synthetase
MLRLNTPVLGKRLKSTLQELQRAIGAGDYVINADETLSCQGMTLNPSEYFCHREAVDSNSPVAAEGTLVVVLDSTRDQELRLEGDARDLNRTIQDLRKRARLAYGDRIILSIAGSGLDPLLTEFGPWLEEQALATELTTNLAEPEAQATARLSTGDAHVAIRRVGPANPS